MGLSPSVAPRFTHSWFCHVPPHFFPPLIATAFLIIRFEQGEPLSQTLPESRNVHGGADG